MPAFFHTVSARGKPWRSISGPIFLNKIPNFPDTIPAYLNFGYRHIFFLYPKKLSYSSRNAYIGKETKSAGAWNANLSSQKSQKRPQTYEFFCDV